jgi:hypothetical protein
VKPALTWIKSNLSIVICCAVVVIVLPAAYITSTAWGESIRKEQEKKANDAFQKVNNAKADYALPQVDPSTPALTEKAVPNKARTDWYRVKREELLTAATEVAKRAEDFNRGVGPDAQAVGRREHTPIVEGLFPGAEAQAQAQLAAEVGEERWNQLPEEERKSKVAARAKALQQEKLYEAEDAFLGQRGHPSPYRRLLEGVRAGGPSDPVRLLEEVSGVRTAELQKIGQRRDLTPEEQARIAKLVEERRLGGYQARARDLSVYATLDVFPTDDRKGSAVRLDRFEAAEIDPYYFYIYQWDLWVLSDLFAAVRLANVGPDGRPASVDQAVVKRIISITMKEPQGLVAGGSMGLEREQTTPTAAVPGMVPTDPSLGVTGRGMGAWNTFYDLRYATMNCVVSSARLPEFLDAIERTNFMTVTGLEITDVKIWEDLREGYYYGPEHVVKVKVDIESAWLRSWTAKYMPSRVAAVLGVPGVAPEAAPGAEPAVGGSAVPAFINNAPNAGSRKMAPRGGG